MWLQSQDLFCILLVALSLELWEPRVYTLSNSFVPGTVLYQVNMELENR